MKPAFIDIHAHVNFNAFKDDREAVIKRALDACVCMINVGTQVDTSRAAIELSEKYPEGVYAIVGLHPVHTAKSYHDEEELGEGGKEFISRGETFDAAAYRNFLGHPKVVGIGECGLDYFRIEDESLRGRQEEAFRRQIELAIEFDKPLMLHLRSGSGRSAYNDAFSILKTYHERHGSVVRGNLHFFAGSIEEARPFLDLGFTFSFTGVITFAREYAKIIEFLPLDRIMSETDCPYVSPTPHRGTRNEPLYVQEVVRKIAEIKKRGLDEVQNQILKTAAGFFKIPLM